MDNNRKTIYYEFYKLEPGNESTGTEEQLKGTGTRTLGENSITVGIDMVPTATLTVPLESLPVEVIKDGRQPALAMYIIKIFYMVDGKVKYKFSGTIDTMDIDYANYSVKFNLSHRIARMREWVMPTGYTVKQGRVDYIMGPDGADIGYSSTMGPDTQSYDARVEFEYRDGVEAITMDISFSSTNKLAAMNEVVNATEDMHFLVDLRDNEDDRIIFGKFGSETPVIISPAPVYDDDCTGHDISNYVAMLTEPSYTVDYTNHFNRAVVLCGDVAEGVMHMTLKEIYEDKSAQRAAGMYTDDNGQEQIAFPVGMYDKEINIQPETAYKPQTGTDKKKYNTTKINNEKIYKNYEVVAYANNDNREYYVTDSEQLAEDQVIRHTVYNFIDLIPIPELEEEVDLGNGKTKTIEKAITDADRKEIAKRAYYKAIRALKAQRPEHVFQFNCTPLPASFTDGDKVNFYYTKKVTRDSERCPSSTEDIVIANIDESLYVTKRTITFDDDMNEINTVTLDKELRVRDISAVEYELRSQATGNGGGGGSTWVDDIGNPPRGKIDHDPEL